MVIGRRTGLDEPVAPTESDRVLVVRLDRQGNTAVLHSASVEPKAAGASAIDASLSSRQSCQFFGALFAARTDVYATRWENRRTGRAAWVPAVAGGWRKGQRPADRDYLPLTPQVLTAHLSGDVHVGLYPPLDGDRCYVRVCDFLTES